MAAALRLSDGDRRIAAEGRLLGGVGLHDILLYGKREAEAGYWVRRSACGRGVAATAIRAMVAFGVNELGLIRVSMRIRLDNRSSRRAAERAGARFEGVARHGLVAGEARVDAAAVLAVASRSRAALVAVTALLPRGSRRGRITGFGVWIFQERGCSVKTQPIIRCGFGSWIRKVNSKREFRSVPAALAPLLSHCIPPGPPNSTIACAPRAHPVFFGVKSNADRHREVVQRNEGLRVHQAGRRRR